MIFNIKKTILLISLPLLVSGNVFAMDNNFFVEFTNHTQNKNTSLLEEATNSLWFLTNYPSVTDRVKNVHIKVNVNNKFKESTSNYDKNNCQIEINYQKDLNPHIYKNLNIDLMIASLHEIGHCVLGKEVLLAPIQWQKNLNLTNEDLDNLSKKIDDKKEKAFKNLKNNRDCNKDKKCIPQEIFTTFPPMLAYHEIFADLWAIARYSEISCNSAKETILTLEKYRSNVFLKNPKVLNQSFLSTYYMQDTWECGKKFDFKELTFYTQKGLIDYLDND